VEKFPHLLPSVSDGACFISRRRTEGRSSSEEAAICLLFQEKRGEEKPSQSRPTPISFARPALDEKESGVESVGVASGDMREEALVNVRLHPAPLRGNEEVPLLPSPCHLLCGHGLAFNSMTAGWRTGLGLGEGGEDLFRSPRRLIIRSGSAWLGGR